MVKIYSYQINNQLCHRLLILNADRNLKNLSQTKLMICFTFRVGNKYLLQTSELWKKLLKHYDDVGCLVEANGFLRGPSGRNIHFHGRRKYTPYEYY